MIPDRSHQNKEAEKELPPEASTTTDNNKSYAHRLLIRLKNAYIHNNQTEINRVSAELHLAFANDLAKKARETDTYQQLKNQDIEDIVQITWDKII